MRRLWVGLLPLALAGCGGGGGGVPLGQLVGRILNVETGGPANPSATVQAGNRSVQTALADGSFVVAAADGTTQVLVDPHNAFGITMFSFPPSSGVTDVGDLWVGPTQVTLTGKVLDSTNLNPVSGAGVSFGGRNGVTAADGSFNLAGVAYSDTDQAAFWGIAGGVRATGYFFTTFSTAPNVASAGVVALPDILITPSNDPNPPPPPGNIQGRVLASPSPSGALVSLSSGATIIRVFNVGSDGSYFFWVPPGSYTISFAEGALTAPDVGVTVASQTDVVHVPDVTLH